MPIRFLVLILVLVLLPIHNNDDTCVDIYRLHTNPNFLLLVSYRRNRVAVVFQISLALFLVERTGFASAATGEREDFSASKSARSF